MEISALADLELPRAPTETAPLNGTQARFTPAWHLYFQRLSRVITQTGAQARAIYWVETEDETPALPSEADSSKYNLIIAVRANGCEQEFEYDPS